MCAGPKTPPASFTIGQLLDAYLEARLQQPHSKSFEHNFTRVREYFADYTPEQLNDGVWARYRKWRTSHVVSHAGARASKKKRRTVSDATAVRELNSLRGTLGWARRNGYKGLADVQVHLPDSAANVRQRYLSRVEAERLIKACIEPHTALFVRISVATGARMSAVLGLKWSDVTWPVTGRGGKPHHEDQIGLYDDETGFKLAAPITFDLGRGRGNKRRGTGVVSQTNYWLWGSLVRAHAIRKSDYVIEWRGKQVEKVDLRDAYRRAGIIDATQHTLKHSCCSWLVQAGESYERIAKLIGTSAKTVERHYGHLSPEHLATSGSVLSLGRPMPAHKPGRRKAS